MLLKFLYLKPILFNIHSIESGVPQIQQIFFLYLQVVLTPWEILLLLSYRKFCDAENSY
jgi:membrane protein CcdC involved in cytochrome C biogenesis